MAGAIVEGANVDEGAGGLSSLLEESIPDPRALVDGTPSLKPAGSTSPQMDVHAAMIAQQRTAAAHQARAVAALEQADAAEDQDHHQTHSQLQVINGPHPDRKRQQQHSSEKVSFTSTPPPLPIVAQDLPQQTLAHAAPVTIPSSGTGVEENSMPITPVTSDIALSVISPSSICLCQQPARIPRPRNAFILFRQHNQATVVAKHPGKPNPEISKIIGEMWRESPQEAKNVWQKHAEEEKKKHLARYPEYRYQPRRNGKKGSAIAAGSSTGAFMSPTGSAVSPPLETTICQICGGRTGGLSTPQTPATPGSAVPKTPGLTQPPHGAQTPTSAPLPSKRRRSGAEDDVSRGSIGNFAGPVGEQTGIEALLQLGNLQNEEGVGTGGLQTSPKRQKINGGSPAADVLATPPLQQSLYSAHFSPQSHNPNIDPFLQHNGFEIEPGIPSLDSEGNIPHQVSSLSSQLSNPYIVKPIKLPPIQKIHAFDSICKPLLTGPEFSRLPVVAIEGDDIDVVSELFHALVKEISKSEPTEPIDESDIFAKEQHHKLEESTGIADGMPTRDNSGLDPRSDLKGAEEEDDIDAAKYLSHVASWRRRCVQIKNAVHNNDISPRMVLVNRYMVSRSNSAAVKLSSNELSQLQHWQWCATVWRGCVGPDMTIYVVSVPIGSTNNNDSVDVREGGKIVLVKKEMGGPGGKSWDDKIIRRLGFEVGEVVRSLRGFMVDGQ